MYPPVKKEIVSRLKYFKEIWKRGDEEDIFTELVFCLLTPQSKAKSCDNAVGCLLEKDLMIRGNKGKIAQVLKGKVRFHNTKAKNIVKARKLFTEKNKIVVKQLLTQFADVRETREWLVRNVRGLGYKEASHFLRNIGYGEELAILDRHILKNLSAIGVIEEIPSSLSKERYLRIERKMIEFSEKIKIPLSHLDLLLWYKETGEIFK